MTSTRQLLAVKTREGRYEVMDGYFDTLFEESWLCTIAFKGLIELGYTSSWFNSITL